MTIHTKPLYRFLTALGLIATLAACGSGGDDNKDFTPAPFTIPAVTDAAVSTEVISSPVPLTDFNQDVDISITNGSYSIAGGDYTTAKGTISSGKSVTVKVTTSASTNTPVEAVLTVGGVSNSFKVTTKADTTPDAFSFTAATGAVPKIVNTSAAITVAGIDIAVPISVTGGEYSINDAAFTSTAGTVSKNQTVKVRGTAATTTTTSSNVELTIGGVKAAYAITTLADTVAPTAQILFPPPVSMTEGNTILVRGSASDDYNTVTSVKVNGVAVTPKAAGDFSTWQISVPLTASTDTSLIVTTEDSVGNNSTNAAQVMIRQAAMSNAFPDADNQFDSVRGVALDRLNGRNRLFVAGSGAITTVDLATAKRTMFMPTPVFGYAIAIDSLAERLFALSFDDSPQFLSADLNDASKFEIHTIDPAQDVDLYSLAINQNLTTTTITSIGNVTGDVYSTTPAFLTLNALSTSTMPNNENIIGGSYAIAFDKLNNRYLATSTKLHAIFSVDATTGVRKIISSNTVGTGEVFGEIFNAREADFTSIAIDDVNQRAIVFESRSGKLFSINLANGNRSLISSVTESNAENIVRHSFGTVIVSPESYALISADRDTLHGVFAIDLVTGKRVVFSKSAGASPY